MILHKGTKSTYCQEQIHEPRNDAPVHSCLLLVFWEGRNQTGASHLKFWWPWKVNFMMQGTVKRWSSSLGQALPSLHFRRLWIPSLLLLSPRGRTCRWRNQSKLWFHCCVGESFAAIFSDRQFFFTFQICPVLSGNAAEWMWWGSPGVPAQLWSVEFGCVGDADVWRMSSFTSVGYARSLTETLYNAVSVGWALFMWLCPQAFFNVIIAHSPATFPTVRITM